MTFLSLKNARDHIVAISRETKEGHLFSTLPALEAIEEIYGVRIYIYCLETAYLPLQKTSYGFSTLNIPTVPISEIVKTTSVSWLQVIEAPLPSLRIVKGMTEEPLAHMRLLKSFRKPLLRNTPDLKTRIESKISTNLRSNLERSLRKLERLGTLSLQIHTLKDNPSSLENFYTLENSGWKGKRGTSLLKSPKDKAFFEAIIKTADETFIVTLMLDDTPLASSIIPTHKGTLYHYKIGYDERYARYGIGTLLLNLWTNHLTENPFPWILGESCVTEPLSVLDKQWPDQTLFFDGITPKNTVAHLTAWGLEKKQLLKENLKAILKRKP